MNRDHTFTTYTKNDQFCDTPNTGVFCEFCDFFTNIFHRAPPVAVPRLNLSNF